MKLAFGKGASIISSHPGRSNMAKKQPSLAALHKIKKLVDSALSAEGAEKKKDKKKKKKGKKKKKQ
jgi:hypothetical protein